MKVVGVVCFVLFFIGARSSPSTHRRQTQSIPENFSEDIPEDFPEDDCTFAVELLFLQDVSSSFEDDLPKLLVLLPLFIENLTNSFPESRMALATFSDYPMPDAGWYAYHPLDFCFSLEVNFTTSAEEIEKAIANLTVVSGLDLPESQLSTLHHAVRGGYFTDDEYSQSGFPFARLVVLSTDASYHHPGDLAKILSRHPDLRVQNPSFFTNDTEFTVVPNNGDNELKCSGYDLEDYASVEQVAEAFRALDVMLMLLVTEDRLDLYNELASQLKSIGVWVTVHEIEENSSNLSEAMEEGMNEVYERICLATTSTPYSSTPQQQQNPHHTTANTAEEGTDNTISITTLTTTLTTTQTSTSLTTTQTSTQIFSTPTMSKEALSETNFYASAVTATTAFTTTITASPEDNSGVAVAVAAGAAAGVIGAAVAAVAGKSYFAPVSASSPVLPAEEISEVPTQVGNRETVQVVMPEMFA